MLNPAEEREYARLREMGKRLHIPIPEALWKLEVLDKDGGIIKTHIQRSHSWVRNAYNILFCQLATKNGDDPSPNWGDGYLNLRQTNGNIYGYDHCIGICDSDLDDIPTTYGYIAGGGDDARGIQVGSGTTVESLDDYVMETLINDGAGAGELNYATAETHKVTWTAATRVMKDELVRYFNNNSGGSIDVNEVGLTARNTVHSTSMYILMARDKLSSTVTVPNTGQLKVTYTVQLTYPA